MKDLFELSILTTSFDASPSVSSYPTLPGFRALARQSQHPHRQHPMLWLSHNPTCMFIRTGRYSQYKTLTDASEVTTDNVNALTFKGTLSNLEFNWLKLANREKRKLWVIWGLFGATSQVYNFLHCPFKEFWAITARNLLLLCECKGFYEIYRTLGETREILALN